MAEKIYTSRENFERADVTTFEQGQTYKISKYAKHSFSLTNVQDGATPSGFMSTELNGMGAKVLVVGDQSAVTLDFGETVTNVKWKYSVIIDYTEDDLKVERPDLSGKIDVTKLNKDNFSEGFSVSAITKDGVVTENLPFQEYSNSKDLGTATMTALVFKTSRAGSMQIDALEWEKVPNT